MTSSGNASPKHKPRNELKRKDREGQSVRGVQHQDSELKTWREHCKHLTKQIQEQERLWREDKSWLTWDQWESMLRHRDEQWDQAEAASFKLGHPFQDRNGQMQCNEPRDLVGLALRSWCQKKRIAYC